MTATAPAFDAHRTDAPRWVVRLYQVLPPALGLLVLLNPFPYLFSLKEALFYLPATLFLVSLAFYRRGLWLATPLAVPLALFSLWAVLGLSTALQPGPSVHDFFSHWIRYLLLYYLLVHFFRVERRLELLGRVLLVSGALFSAGIWIWWYLVEGHPLNTRLGLYWLRLATSVNGFTTVLTLILGVHTATTASDPRWRRAGGAAAAVGLIASVMSQSRSTLLGLSAAAVFLLFDRRRILVALMLVVTAVVVLTPVRQRIFTAGDHYTARLGQTRYYLEIVKDHPWTGIGFALDTMRDARYIDPDRYLARLPAGYRNPPHPYLWPHNLLLDLAVRTGVPGAVGMVLLLARAAWMALTMLRRGRSAGSRAWGRCLLAALAMFVVKAMFEPVFTHFCQTLLGTLLAMITIAWGLERGMTVPTVVARHRWPFFDAGPPGPEPRSVASREGR